MLETVNRSVEALPTFMCLLIDTPSNGVDCSILNSSKCIECRVRSYYLTGDSINELYSTSYLICLLIWTLCLFFGMIGVIGSVLIICVLRKRSSSNHGFDLLIMILACCDMLCCLMGILASSSFVLYFGDEASREIVCLYVFYLSWILLLFGRSASQYMTVAITIERCLALSFPFKFRSWFTPSRTRFWASSALTLAIILSIPRSTSRYVTPNIYHRSKLDIPSLENLTYILGSTKLTKFWYRTLGSVHYQVDFWLPLPILLIVNFISYRQVRQMIIARKDLNMVTEDKDIQAAKMFLPVATILAVLHSIPISMYVMVHFYNVLYREIFILTIFSICLNSSVNFFIYYLRGTAFRKEAEQLLKPWLPLNKIFR